MAEPYRVRVQPLTTPLSSAGRGERERREWTRHWVCWQTWLPWLPPDCETTSLHGPHGNSAQNLTVENVQSFSPSPDLQWHRWHTPRDGTVEPLSNPDTIGTEKRVHLSQMSLFQIVCKNCSWWKTPHFRFKSHTQICYDCVRVPYQKQDWQACRSHSIPRDVFLWTLFF